MQYASQSTHLKEKITIEMIIGGLEVKSLAQIYTMYVILTGYNPLTAYWDNIASIVQFPREKQSGGNSLDDMWQLKPGCTFYDHPIQREFLCCYSHGYEFPWSVLILNSFKISLMRGLVHKDNMACLLYTSPSPRDRTRSRMPSSA